MTQFNFMSSIKAVFFDLYNTIVKFDPPRESLQVKACAEFGIVVDPLLIRRAYTAADEFMAQENARFSLQQRCEEDRRKFWSEYEAKLLSGTGIEVSRDQALQIFLRLRQMPSDFALFEDVVPALSQLKTLNLTLALLSNMHRDLGQLCAQLGVREYFDFFITSQEVGAEKPHPAIFLAALERAGAKPYQAIHVGDQYHSDVIGAQGVGIRPLLLDRDGFRQDFAECPRIQSLLEIMRYL